jgi:streptogramin lyase
VRVRRATETLLLALGLGVLSGGFARAQQIVEFDVPTPGSQPLGIAPGPDGALWFTEKAGNKIGRMTPDGAVTEYSIPTPGSDPAWIAAGPDGALWFTEFSTSANKVGRITTQGVITEFSLPLPNSYPLGITAGPDGNVWFTEKGGHKIGRITPEGLITEFGIPALGGVFEADPQSIVTGSDGALWFSDAFTGRVGRITTDGTITLFRIEPLCCAWLAEIAAGPDGNLWFIDTTETTIGRITPSGEITYFTGLGAGQPYGITAGSDGALWFTEGGANRIGRLTTQGIVSHFAIPTASADPEIITAGPDGAVWFTELRANKIGRMSTGIDSPQQCQANSTTLCLNEARFRVNVGWRVPSQGTSGVGTAAPLTGDTGYFWFFSSNNIELVIKVVDGRTFNGHFWVFYGALSDVEYTITVTDMMTGAAKTYVNQQGHLASVADTAAFAAPGPLRMLELQASLIDRGASGDNASVDPVRATPDVTFTDFPLPTPNGVSNGITTGPEGNAWFTNRSGNKIWRSVAESPSQCTTGPSNLCLNADRFRVSVDWRVPSQGTSGVGMAASLTGDTGYFWFFSSNNVELVIKVVDGRTFNGHFWVFYGALSDVEYTITVTDTLTGTTRSYTNTQGQLASVADTAAF